MQYLEAVCEEQKERQARPHPAVRQISASVSATGPASVQFRELSPAEHQGSDCIVLEDANTPVFYNYDIPDKETESISCYSHCEAHEAARKLAPSVPHSPNAKRLLRAVWKAV